MIKLKNIIFLFLLVFSLFANAQLDSLENCLKTAKTKTYKAEIYNKLSDYYLDFNIAKSRLYADSAKIIGLENNDFLIVSNAYVNLANSHLFTGILDSALYYYELSYQNILKTDNKDEIAAALNRLGLAYQHLSQYNQAVEYFFQALKIYETTNSKKGQAEIYNNLGVISDLLEQKKDAENYYQKALNLFIEINNLTGQANVYNNLASLAFTYQNYSKAISYIYKSISISLTLNQLTEAATAYYNAGTYYNEIKNSEKAKICLDSALLLFSQNNNIQGIASVYAEQAKWYLNNNDYDAAIKLLNQSLEYRQQIGNIAEQAQAFLQISEYYLSTQDYENAYLFYNQYIQYRDSIIDENTKSIIAEMSLIYNTEKKDNQIKILQNEAKIKKNFNQFLIIIIIALIIISSLLFYFFRVKSKLLKSNEELLEQEQIFNKFKQEQEKTKRELIENQLLTEQKFNELHRAKLHAELEHNKKELLASTMQVLNKNRTLSEISDFLNKTDAKTPQEKANYSQITQILEANLKLDDDWEQLKLNFEKINSSFVTNLQLNFPKLTKSDLKFLIYMKINLSPKDIAQLTNITTDGVYKRLYRIRKKMKFEKYRNLNDYLDSI